MSDFDKEGFTFALICEEEIEEKKKRKHINTTAKESCRARLIYTRKSCQCGNPHRATKVRLIK